MKFTQSNGKTAFGAREWFTGTVSSTACAAPTRSRRSAVPTCGSPRRPARSGTPTRRARRCT